MENRHISTIIARVIDALRADVTSDLDLVQEAHPGYIDLLTDDGRHYATGTANDTWTIDRLAPDCDVERSLDTRIPITENDAPLIARRIIAAIQEDHA